MTVIADLWAMVKDSREWKQMAEAVKRIPELEARIAALESRGTPSDRVCDHCASGDLVRTGSRPDPTFHVFGDKQQVYRCNACGKESAFRVRNR